MSAPTTGFLLGKFLPPHRGHQYLIEFARNYVDRLTVLVCTIQQEPIPGPLRYQWMCEAFPGVDLVHHTDELPQAPEEHPQFWDIWRASIRRHVPGRISTPASSRSTANAATCRSPAAPSGRIRWRTGTSCCRRCAPTT
jgi:cytidyltransferase-like protein